jgi:hypothetical protein
LRPRPPCAVMRTRLMVAPVARRSSSLLLPAPTQG